MALIVRNKRLIVGLETDLANLSTAISNEVTARSTADGNLASLVTTAKDNLVNAVNEVKTQVNTTDNTVGNLATSTVSGSTVAGQLKTLQTAITALSDSSSLAISDLQQQINNVLSNTDATALNSLSEIVAAFQTADNTLNGAITTLANSASANLTDEINRATTSETYLKQGIENGLDAVITGFDAALNKVTKAMFTHTANTFRQYNTVPMNVRIPAVRIGDKLVFNFYSGVTTYTRYPIVSLADDPTWEATYDQMLYNLLLLTPGDFPWYHDQANTSIGENPWEKPRLFRQSLERFSIGNFSCGRCLIDSVAYDIEVSLELVAPGAYSDFPDLSFFLVAKGLSEAELTQFSEKTFMFDLQIPFTWFSPDMIGTSYTEQGPFNYHGSPLYSQNGNTYSPAILSLDKTKSLGTEWATPSVTSDAISSGIITK